MRVRRASDVFDRRVGDEHVLVHIGEGEIYSLNSTAAAVWEALTHSAEVEDLVARVANQFETSNVEPNELRTEIDLLLKELEDRLLVVREG